MDEFKVFLDHISTQRRLLQTRIEELDTMTGTITCLWLLLALATAKNIGYYPGALPDISSPSLPTQQWNTQDEIGQASFGYSYSGQAATNVRDADGNMAGSWAYVNPEGKLVNVSYIADKRGFRVSSNVLPVTSLADSTAGSVETFLSSSKTDEIPAPRASNDSLCIGNISTRSKRQTDDESSFATPFNSFMQSTGVSEMKEDYRSAQYPFTVALFKYDKTAKRYNLACGGSLISPDTILTAAHCVTDGDVTLDRENLLVKIGVYFLNETEAASHHTKRVNWIDVHFEYNPYNDIALLKLESPVEISGLASTICLPKECHKGAQSGKALFLGWGNTKIGEKNSEQLRYTTAEMIGNKECAKTYTGEKEIADHMMCAIGARDFCENFDGGPLILERQDLNNDCPWVQMGIISFGKGCFEKGKPAVYTRLTSFWPWIEERVTTVY